MALWPGIFSSNLVAFELQEAMKWSRSWDLCSRSGWASACLCPFKKQCPVYRFTCASARWFFIHTNDSMKVKNHSEKNLLIYQARCTSKFNSKPCPRCLNNTDCRTVQGWILGTSEHLTKDKIPIRGKKKSQIKDRPFFSRYNSVRTEREHHEENTLKIRPPPPTHTLKRLSYCVSNDPFKDL